MFEDAHTFSGFSVNDIKAAKEFYANTLGVKVIEDNMGLTLKLAGRNDVFIYEKEDHQPATFTILNFIVSDINDAIDKLAAKGVTMERYDNIPAEQDDRGVLRGLTAGMGPDIAWFKDPAGNVLAVLQEK